MARRSSTAASLVQWGALGVGSYLLYTKARTGDFGPSLKTLADQIHNAFGGLGLDWNPPGSTPPPGGTTPPSTGPCPPIAAYRYVAPDGSRFVVVWKGAVNGYYDDQTQAERAYNALVAAQGCV